MRQDSGMVLQWQSVLGTNRKSSGKVTQQQHKKNYCGDKKMHWWGQHIIDKYLSHWNAIWLQAVVSSGYVATGGAVARSGSSGKINCWWAVMSSLVGNVFLCCVVSNTNRTDILWHVGNMSVNFQQTLQKIWQLSFRMTWKYRDLLTSFVLVVSWY